MAPTHTIHIKPTIINRITKLPRDGHPEFSLRGVDVGRPGGARAGGPDADGVGVGLPVECEVRVGVEVDAVGAWEEASPGGDGCEPVVDTNEGAFPLARTGDRAYDIVRLNVEIRHHVFPDLRDERLVYDSVHRDEVLVLFLRDELCDDADVV